MQVIFILLGVFSVLICYIIVGLTIQGKMTGGLSKKEAILELWKEILQLFKF